MDSPTEHPDRGEGLSLANIIESLGRPKALMFAAAFLSFLLSVALYFSGHREQGIFVGIWVPSILSAGTLLLSGGRHE